MKTKYRGVVEAESGLLLGGVKRHVSAPFYDGRDATRWTVVVAQTNKDASRKVGRVFVEKYINGAWTESS